MDRFILKVDDFILRPMQYIAHKMQGIFGVNNFRFAMFCAVCAFIAITVDCIKTCFAYFSFTQCFFGFMLEILCFILTVMIYMTRDVCQKKHKSGYVHMSKEFMLSLVYFRVSFFIVASIFCIHGGFELAHFIMRDTQTMVPAISKWGAMFVAVILYTCAAYFCSCIPLPPQKSKVRTL